MKSMKKRPARAVSREKAIPVAEDSQSTRAPGARQRGSANVQSANIEAAGAILRDRAPLDTATGAIGAGTQRAAPGSAQSGWSSRQQAERMQARAEESRLGQPQQSGYGGAQQDQHAGSQESPVGPPGSQQTGQQSRTGTGKPGAATPKRGSGSSQ